MRLRRQPTCWTIALALAATASLASADTIILKDGTTLNGTLGRQGNDLVVQTNDGRHLVLAFDQIKKVTLNSAPTPEEKASSAWTHAQAEIKKSDDLTKIIALQEAIIRDFPGTPTADTVRQSVALYKQMQAENWMKFRGEWMSPAKADIRQRIAVDDALAAEGFLRAGKLKDALQKVDAALQSDDQNVQALTLGGLIAYRQNNLTTARSYFERLGAADDANLLAYNNLALISYQQNNQLDGLLQFSKALAVAPDNRLLLDNIAAALLHYTGPPDAKPVTDLLRQYTQAETKMEADMAQQGFYRYGATWMSEFQRDALATAVDQVRGRMDQLDGFYAKAVASLGAVEQDLKDTAAAYDGALSDYNYYSLVVLKGIPGQALAVDPYWASRRDATLNDIDAIVRRRTALEQQRTALTASIHQMHGDAARLSADLTRVQAINTKGVIRLMEPGDVQNPPPPAPLQPPALPAAVLPAPIGAGMAHARLNLVSGPGDT